MIEIIPNWHPFIVHFSIAPLSIATMLFLSIYIPALSSKRNELLTTAKWCLYIGSFATLMAAISGWQAFGSVNHDQAGHSAMSLHRNSALITFFLYLITTVLFIKTQTKKITHWFIIILLIANGSLGITGYLGAENVYRHGLGVMRVPDVNKSVENNHDPQQQHQHH